MQDVDEDGETSFASSTERVRSVLRIGDFRRLWVALSFSSLGDWLGLLAITALATDLGGDAPDLGGDYQAANFALGAVLVIRLLPSLLLGPLAGAFADRFDRRRMMIVTDISRCGLFVSIPMVQELWWLFVAQFLIECFSLFFIPAKEASVPNMLYRKDQLETANQLSLVTTYGITPVVAAGLFALLAAVSRGLGAAFPFFDTNQVDLALYLNAATFLVSAAAVVGIRSIGGSRAQLDDSGSPPSILKLLRDGAGFMGRTRLVRGLTVGIVGAFAAGGAVIGTGKTYAVSLGGGDAAYGILFGAIFVGLGLGMATGPRFARDFPRERLFGLSIVSAGIFLTLTAVMPHLALSVVTIVGVGFGAGIAYLAGMTLLGGEVDDEIRGRTFAFVQAMVRIALITSLALVPILVGLIKQPHITIGDHSGIIDGSRFILFGGGVLAVLVGILAYRQMDDRRSVPLVADLVSAVRRDTTARRRLASGGIFIAFEGGEGVGKTTQIKRLSAWLQSQGLSVLETFEPGATDLGERLRRIILHGDALSPHAEALLFAADRAHHVDTVVRPALERGEIVLTDRYIDSSLAYQGVGRDLPVEEVRRLSRWATGDLRPDLTVLIDLDPVVGLARASKRSVADRLEQESLDFHRQVRTAFRSLAEASPGRYLVVDGMARSDEVYEQVRDAVAGLLSARGGSVPAERQPASTARSTPD